MSASPLQSLVVDSTELDLERLTAILEGRVSLDPGASRLIFARGLRDRSTVAQTILLTLLGQQALSIVSEDVPDGLAPAEIQETAGVNKNSVGPTLTKLREERVVTQEEDGRYTVPGYALDAVEEMLGGIDG